MSNQYYISVDGNDTWVGDRDRPWRTIDHANKHVRPGDTVILMSGVYKGTINPKCSGSGGNPIVYRSLVPWKARVQPDAKPCGSGGCVHAIDLQGREYIHVEGLHIDGLGQGGWGVITDCRHITVTGCRMINAGPAFGVHQCKQVFIRDNVFSKDRVHGDMLYIYDSDHVLFEGNALQRVGHCPLQIAGCRYVVVRANSFHNEWGRNYEFWATGRILIEHNIVTESSDSAYSADSRSKNLYDDGIFRFNRVFANKHTPMNSFSYLAWGASPTGRYREPFRLTNSRIYHNTIVDNLGFGWELEGKNVSANTFQNNIFHRNDWAGGDVQIVFREGVSTDNRLKCNLISGGTSGLSVIRYEDEYCTLEQAESKAGYPSHQMPPFWSECSSNIDADPVFLDRDNHDYRLGANSPAIDAGLPLTLAVGSGSGKVLPVSDGIPFFDGFGIEGESGDLIAIGQERQSARVMHVELRYYQPARLHLDREVTWQDGSPVSLAWAGHAPDIGACQVSNPDNRVINACVTISRPYPGQDVRFHLDALHHNIQCICWNFGDGSYSSEVEPIHRYEHEGSYAATARVTFKDGSNSIDVVHVKVQKRQGYDAPLMHADFEPITRETQWGHYFKFYRSWLTGFEHRPRKDKHGYAIRLFYDPAKNNEAAGVIAPGVWSIRDYPIIQFAYNIKPGTPVSVCVEPFESPRWPKGFMLGGTADKSSGNYIDLGQYDLIADNTWRDATIDLRSIQKSYPELTHLYRFMFFTDWKSDTGQEFWFDRFAIMPPGVTCSFPETDLSEFMGSIVGDIMFPGSWEVFPLPRGCDYVVPHDVLRSIPKSLDVNGVIVESHSVQAVRNQFDFTTLWGKDDCKGRAGYAMVSLYSECEQTVTIGMGADWKMQAWLNGEPVLDTTCMGNEHWPPSINDYHVRVTLAKGENVLAVKIISGRASSVLALGGPRELRTMEFGSILFQ